ncbi:MAG: hypothetical protein RIM68_05435, partial [Arenibacter sp.]
ALPTPALFALKGLDVFACPWKKPEVAREQVQMMYIFKENATPEMKEHFLGMMHTVWSSASEFIKSYHTQKAKEINPVSQEVCFRAMMAAIKDLELIGENTH